MFQHNSGMPEEISTKFGIYVTYNHKKKKTKQNKITVRAEKFLGLQLTLKLITRNTDINVEFIIFETHEMNSGIPNSTVL